MHSLMFLITLSCLWWLMKVWWLWWHFDDSGDILMALALGTFRWLWELYDNSQMTLMTLGTLWQLSDVFLRSNFWWFHREASTSHNDPVSAVKTIFFYQPLCSENGQNPIKLAKGMLLLSGMHTKVSESFVNNSYDLVLVSVRPAPKITCLF